MAPVIIIGNSDGIGLALTRLLLDEGRSVIGFSRSASPITSSRYTHTVCDVASVAYRDAVAAAFDQHEDLRTCIYCAGIGNELDPLTWHGEHDTFEVNLMAVVTTLQVAIPHFRAAGTGHFMALSSLADVLFIPDAPAYNASKAGLSAYLKALALRFAREDIDITNVRFGFVDTKMASAPIRPMMISTDRAARVLRRCMDRRPMQVSYPRSMSLVARMLRWWLSMRVFVGR